MVSIHARAERATRVVRFPAFIQQVSIHARAERATALESQKPKKTGVSIHARAERATCRSSSGKSSTPGFNPRTRRACDPQLAATAGFLPVSIHARAERATRPDYLIFPFLRVSIHARAERATPPDGVVTVAVCGFNPRTRRACDSLFLVFCQV